MDDILGRTVGNYRIVEQIGRGGMATVYKGYHSTLDRYVAIKVLPEYFAHDHTFFERFLQEAQSVACLRHPHITQVFDFGRDGDMVYLVMEYVEGGTLQERLGKPLLLTDALGLTAVVADALGYAHNNGIIHRDVKPSNILLTKDGEPILSDFGIAKMVERQVTLTQAGMGVGTPEYMAPEQAMGEVVDGRTDIYSLGIVLYEMVTGRVPYTAETPLALVLRHMNDPLPSPRSINASLPASVEEIIVTCLAKSVDDRYQTMYDLVDAVNNVLGAEGTGTQGEHTMVTIPRPRPTPAGGVRPRTPTPGSRTGRTPLPAPSARLRTPAPASAAPKTPAPAPAVPKTPPLDLGGPTVGFVTPPPESAAPSARSKTPAPAAPKTPPPDLGGPTVGFVTPPPESAAPSARAKTPAPASAAPKTPPPGVSGPTARKVTPAPASAAPKTPPPGVSGPTARKVTPAPASAAPKTPPPGVSGPTAGKVTPAPASAAPKTPPPESAAPSARVETPFLAAAAAKELLPDVGDSTMRFTTPPPQSAAADAGAASAQRSTANKRKKALVPAVQTEPAAPEPGVAAQAAAPDAGLLPQFTRARPVMLPGLSGVAAVGAVVLALVIVLGVGAVAVSALTGRGKATATPVSAVLAVAASATATTAPVVAVAPTASATNTPPLPTATPMPTVIVAGTTPVGAAVAGPSVTPTATTAIVEPALGATPAPVGLPKRLVYADFRGPDKYGDFNVLVLDLPGSSPRLLAEFASYPIVSPDGSRVLYFSWTDGGFFTVRLDGSQRARLSSDKNDAYPAWSPDGKRIAFENGDNLWVMNADGTGRQLLVEGASEPSWSNDSTHLVYKGCVPPRCGLVVAGADGQNKKLITTDPTDSNPAWAPDSNKILFTTHRSGSLEAWTVLSDGSLAQSLTPLRTNTAGGRVNSGAATWMQGGRGITFRSDRDGAWGIYVMNADGSNVRRLASSNVADDWWRAIVSVAP